MKYEMMMGELQEHVQEDLPENDQGLVVGAVRVSWEAFKATVSSKEVCVSSEKVVWPLAFQSCLIFAIGMHRCIDDRCCSARLPIIIASGQTIKSSGRRNLLLIPLVDPFPFGPMI